MTHLHSHTKWSTVLKHVYTCLIRSQEIRLDPTTMFATKVATSHVMNISKPNDQTRRLSVPEDEARKQVPVAHITRLLFFNPLKP
jgi:hypothetical protein